jgi:membrane-anchored protein YejM (alkaline phosphatase superfamily)
MHIDFLITLYYGLNPTYTSRSYKIFDPTAFLTTLPKQNTTYNITQNIQSQYSGLKKKYTIGYFMGA